MPAQKDISIVQLYERLTDNERIIVDVLRQLIRYTLPPRCKEKLAYGVPYFYGKKGICIVWPASVPRGGIREGVLLGFWYGCKLKDTNNYLTHGTNKQIFYKIFKKPEDIRQRKIITLLKEAIHLDEQW